MEFLRRGRGRSEFERFVAGSGDDLLRAAYLMVWDAAEAEELAQECLLRVARRWSRVRRMENPPGYARRVLVNLALDGRTRRKRRTQELQTGTAPERRAGSANDLDRLAVRAELREALGALPVRQRAVLVLRYFDYYSRTRARRATLAGAGVLTGAGLTATVVAMAGLGGGAQPALAGWSATPTHAQRAQVADAEATCMTQIPTPSGNPPSAWRTVLTDTRGGWTVVIFENAEDFASCFAGNTWGGTGGGSGKIAAAPPAGQIKLEGLANGAAQPYTLYYGRVGPGVSAVTLPLNDGTHVSATVAAGWFAAWWPGSQLVQSAELTTEHGIVTQQLHAPPGA